MDRNDLAVYRRRVSRSISLVERAIKADTCLSKVEWFDFLFKSCLVGYNSKSTKYYRILNKDIYRVSECFAEVFSYILDICIDGYDNYVVSSYAKRVVHRMNKLSNRCSKIKVDSYDKNGYLFIILSSGKKKPITFSISNKEDAIDALIHIVGYCTKNVNSVSVSGEFTKFLTAYLGKEYTKFLSKEDPTPIVDNYRYEFSDFMKDYDYNTLLEDYWGKIIAIS